MNDYKDKLLEAVQDGSLDAYEVLEAILNYGDGEDLAQGVIEDNQWEEACGIRVLDDYTDDDDMM